MEWHHLHERFGKVEALVRAESAETRAHLRRELKTSTDDMRAAIETLERQLETLRAELSRLKP